MVLETGARVLPQISVAVQVSVTSPPQTPGVDVKVETFDVPLIRQSPLPLLLKLIVLDAGISPHATVIEPGATMVGNAAGSTEIVRDCVEVLLKASVNVHDSV